MDNVTAVCVCIAEDKKSDKSGARSGSLKSHPDDESYDYGDKSFVRRKNKRDYIPVFVPEEEKRKCTQFAI